jgi:LacI family transcriptional regulator
MITMADVAQKAGVARSTASHVLSQRHGENVRIPEATRQRVLEAAYELGYRPNALARSVRSGNTRMIGYLVDEPRYEPYWKIMVGALEAGEELRLTLKLLSVSGHTLAERVRQCTELRLGGIIARVSGDKSVLFEEANHARMPVVMVDEGIPQPFGARIASDDSVRIGRALEHLTQLGHRNIAFIGSGFPTIFPTEERTRDIGTAREELFRREMEARGLDLPEGYVTHDTVMVYSSEAEAGIDDASARAATDALLSHPAGRPSAAFYGEIPAGEHQTPGDAALSTAHGRRVR